MGSKMKDHYFLSASLQKFMNIGKILNLPFADFDNWVGLGILAFEFVLFFQFILG